MFQYISIVILSNIIRIFPLKVVRQFKYPIGFVYYLFTPKSSFRLHRRRKFLRDSGINNYSPLLVKIYYAQYWIETLWLNTKIINYPENFVSINDIDTVNKIINKKVGFIIALPHHGNWEYAIPAGNRIGLDLVAVAEPLSNERILNWFVSLRTSLGCKIILGGKNSNQFNKIKNELENGKAVCLVSERHLLKAGAPTNFFNKIAAFPTGAIKLSLITGCPILPTTCIATKDGFENYFGRPFYVPHFGNESQSINNGLSTLAKEFENLISIDPNQWHSLMPVWSDE